MANQNSQWEELGRNIQSIVDKAVNSQDYQKLGQTIRQTVDRVVDLGRQAEKPRIIEQQDVSVYYGPTGSITAKGVVKIVGGALLGVLSLAVLGVGALVLILSESGVLPGVAGVVGCVSGGALIGSGVGDLNLVSRFKIYKKTLGQKTYCTLEKLAKAAGRSVKSVRKEIDRLITLGLLPEGHLNNEQTMLITSHATYREFERNRLELEERKRREDALIAQKKESTHSLQVREVLDRGERFVLELRRCNDAIPGAEVSGKIARMERTVERIFDRADSNPEVIPDLKKLLDYYLPMTVKLLDAYAEMDDQTNPGETIRNSMREIEQTLDTLNLAFDKLLDDLFEETALDVSSDISVLNTLLAQEGLTEDGLSQMKKQRNL